MGSVEVRVKNVKIIYFEGCPNAEPLMKMMAELGMEFEKIDQGKLASDSEFKNFSSPTILKANEVVFGAEASGGGCSLNLPSKEDLKKKLQ